MEDVADRLCFKAVQGLLLTHMSATAGILCAGLSVLLRNNVLCVSFVTFACFLRPVLFKTYFMRSYANPYFKGFSGYEFYGKSVDLSFHIQ
jgi:hypothetical protein